MESQDVIQYLRDHPEIEDDPWFWAGFNGLDPADLGVSDISSWSAASSLRWINEGKPLESAKVANTEKENMESGKSLVGSRCWRMGCADHKSLHSRPPREAEGVKEGRNGRPRAIAQGQGAAS